MKDIKGRELKDGDILLNLEDTRSPFDSWQYLIVTKDCDGEFFIRDFNAWNCGWDSSETFYIGRYPDLKNILSESESMSAKNYCEGLLEISENL